MRRVAGTALTVASMFLGMVAILIDAPALFYMSFALIATLLASNLQSYLATRALRIERIAPSSVHIGELVTVEIVLWSERKIRRPLVTVEDQLPERLAADQLGPSLPVAPAYDLPVRTMYQFRPMKRGRFKWRNLKVTATDALGLTVKTVAYQTDPTEVIVIPTPIPVMIDLPTSAGWGVNEAISGQAAGAGIEPRGIRQYTFGDSVRHIHWRSSARTGVLQVKEFQAGSQGAAAFLLQRSFGSDVGLDTVTTLDAMCGHALYLAEMLMKQGVNISFPIQEESKGTKGEAERREEIALLLGTLMADSEHSIGDDLIETATLLPAGTTIYVMVSIDDGSLLGALQQLRSQNSIVVLTYDAESYQQSKADISAARFSDSYRMNGALVAAMPEVAS